MHIKKDVYLDKIKTKPNVKVMLKNAGQAFLFGGIVSLIGQTFIALFEQLDVPVEDCPMYMTGTMILLAGILSALGIYDRIGQIAKCGLVIPITGFANSMVSSAMEYKPEGVILGVGANTFKLASSVLALGVSFAAVVAILRYLVSII